MKNFFDYHRITSHVFGELFLFQSFAVFSVYVCVWETERKSRGIWLSWFIGLIIIVIRSNQQKLFCALSATVFLPTSPSLCIELVQLKMIVWTFFFTFLHKFPPYISSHSSHYHQQWVQCIFLHDCVVLLCVCPFSIKANKTESEWIIR